MPLSLWERGWGEGTNVSRIIHLTARFNVKTSLRKDDLDLIAERSRLHGFSIDDQRQHLAFNARTGVWIVLDAMLIQSALRLQASENLREELRILASQRTHGSASSGCNAVFVHRGAEAFLVHVESIFTRDVAGDFDGKSVGGIKIKSLAAIQD